MTISPSLEQVVAARYSQAAQACETQLCCPVDYDPKYLDIIPDEIKERDYGCGNPAEFVHEGETVLDLGSGGGKICYIAAQVVGPRGRVIGVDMNDDMLALAEKYRSEVGQKLGYDNVEFRKGRIQDLKLDLRLVDEYLAGSPIRSAADVARFETDCDSLRRLRPLVPDGSVEVVLSNCVLNLVRPEDKERLFAEMFRVVRRGGRVAISDIVSDEDVPEVLQQDTGLWSGCISGAYREDEFLAAFARAGFHGMQIVKRDEKPWRTVQGIEFRAVTVLAYKGEQGQSLERRQAVIYRGLWRTVIDDDGLVLERGQRMAVSDKTFHKYRCEPYANDIIPVEPLEAVPRGQAIAFDGKQSTTRHPRETKGKAYDLTDLPGASCCNGSGEWKACC